MDYGFEQRRKVSVEQVRGALSSKTPRTVYNALVPFLREEWRSNGDRGVINEIAGSIGQLVYTWFQSSEAMSYDDKQALYLLLRPDEVVMKTLLQYNTLQRQQQQQAVGDGDGWLSIGLDSLPSEWHGQAALAAAYLRAHAPKSVRVVERPGSVELRVGALEYVLYHVCRALVPAPGVGVRQGTLVAKSVVSSLSHELIRFFLPVAVPTADVSDSDHLRPLLHMAQSSGGQQQQKRTVGVDLLDVCEHGQAVDVAQYFVFCAALAWLPAGADPAQWDAKTGHVVGLSLMHAAMEYMAKGELQQMEQAKARGKGGARVEMNGSVRSVVRRQMAGPLSDTLALVVELGKRAGVAEASEMWLAYFVQAVRTWARYAMPWHGTGTSSTTTTSSEASSAGLSEAWQQRMRVAVWGVGAAMYAPVLEDITRLLAAPHMNLLARAPRSAIDDASALDSLRGADALRAVECIASAFAEPELRAILVAVDSVWGPPHHHRHGQVGAVSLSPRFNALVADATRLLSSATSAEALPPPQVADSSVFVSPHSALFRDLVVALQRADVLCDRQLRLLDATPSQSTSDRAQAAATHVLDVVARAFSANASAEPLSTAESARLRSDSLRADKKRISRVRARLAAVFQASAADVDAVPFVLAECPAPPAARRKEPSGKGPEMDHGALTPRGRWEVKTGRRKFTAMSLVAPPTGDDILLLPRGPRAVYSARSYESQWLLDHALRFNGVANRHYQRALDAIEACNTPIPHALRNAHLDFRWVAAYQNLRFLALVLFLFMLVRCIF
ncbi:hypothetical protein FBU31_000804 [Coemansia sp. 'formosensis']|nr:hypothetical protein FBU31_000804 [Coemansia sp. 'formosensis']